MEKHRVFVPSIIALACCGVSLFAQEKADYFIIADPSDYTIFNQYEQPLSLPESEAFLSYSPLRIVERNVTLGDQITKALKFSFRQRNYFLLHGDRGTFIGEKSKQGRQSFANCLILDDTIEVVGGMLKMTDGSGAFFELRKGIRCHRVFKAGSRWYLFSLGGEPRFGWSTLEPKNAWKKSDPATVSPESCVRDTTLPPTIKERIVEKMFAANEAYKAHFSHFNTLTKREKSIPQWNYDCGSSRIRCELVGPYKNGDQLAESTRDLVHGLKNLLIGTDFQVTFGNGEIVIQRKASGK